MRIITWQDFITGAITIPGRAGFTTGVFDGLHRGHVIILNRLTSRQDTRSVLSTFSSNPFKFFFPERYPGDICTLTRKIELIESLGVDYLLLIDFSTDFSKLTGRDFFDRITERIDVRHLVLGRNHRCGHRGDTGAEEVRNILEPAGVTVDIIDPLIIDGHPVSSTRIREAVTGGDVEKAGKLIGRPFSLDLREGHAVKNGLTARIPRDSLAQIIPHPGRYRCLARNERTAVSAVLEIDDRELMLNMEKPLDVTGIDFLHKDDRKD